MRLFLWGALLCLVALEVGAKARQKSVVTWLDSKWKSTSYIQEASEFLARESNDLFWTFVDRMSDVYASGALADPTDREIYDLVIKEAKSLLTTSRLRLLKFSLSLRALSPAVEMKNQIAETTLGDRDCSTFVEVHGTIACDHQNLDSLIKAADVDSRPDVFSADYHFPGSKSTTKPLVILYGEIGSPAINKFYSNLKKLAGNKEIDLVIRHYSKTRSNQPVRLSGYGVELAIKSTEYKAQDDTKITANVSADGSVVEEEETEDDLAGFNFKKLKDMHPSLKDGLTDLKSHLLEVDELAPLKVWELQDLSYQAAAKVVAAQPEEALGVLQDISQNFPLLARSLTRSPIKSDLRQEVESNQESLQEDLSISAGDSALYLNGMNIDLDTLDIYQLLETVKKEEKLADGFFNMGFRKEYLSLLMNLDLEDDTTSYAVDFRPANPEYLNDLEKDKIYKDWGNSVKLLIQPYFPGMIRPIARNFYTLVFFVDPATEFSHNLLKIATSFYDNEVPFKIGFVFVVNGDKSISGVEDPGVALLNYYNFAKTEFDGKTHKALHELIKVFDANRGKELTSDDVIKAFKKRFKDADEELVFAQDTDYDAGRIAGAEFLESSGLGKVPKVLLNGIPLDDAGLNGDRFEETVVTEVMKITPNIQRMIMDGKLTDKANVLDFIMQQPDVLPRLNTRIMSNNNDKNIFLDLTDVMEYKVNSVSEFASLSPRQRNAYMVQKMKYLSKNDDVMTRPVTIWIVGDMETEKGRELFYSAIKYLKHSHNGRIGLIHNPSDRSVKAKDTVVTHKIQSAIFTIANRQHARSFVTKLVKEDNVQAIKQGTTTLKDLQVHGMDFNEYLSELNALPDTYLAIDSYFATHALQLAPGDIAVVINGQVIGPLGEDETMQCEDLAVLEKFNVAKYAKHIAEQVDAWEVEQHTGKSSDLVMRVSALIMRDPIKKKRQWVVPAQETFSVTISAGDNTSSQLELIAIVDPLTRAAQKLAPLLATLSTVLNANIKLVMNPRSKLSEMPLKSFFRLVVEPELLFLGDGSLKPGPSARFSSLPQKQLLTLNMIPPEAWLVESVDAIYDLDNIKMDTVESDVLAAYELEYLLIEGHCFDEVSGNPPRGLQVILGTQKEPVTVDTTVMANLGYFQLKANPGAWTLQLRPGRSSDIYEITTHQNTDSDFNSPQVKVVLDSFTGKIVRIRVKKRPGMESENLLTDPKDKQEEPSSIWQSISETVSSYTQSITGTGAGDENEINIFSLASGHLYERLMRIMFVSVMKTTKAPVKFWLLKNYLSPHFKKILPYMAEHYGFDYELVQYKWPRWLHGQTEKQRLMWGYKILFLDVLFPLDVKKIIFIDADQVVRDDLLKLMRFDLEGAPYGYVPFCDSRTEMDGFRFWKSGYWASHLGPRKYHISALYVVDLKKFRQIAAGDRLRGQYQGLSADPNSLSNLDQDLPNNMIHQVRIKSLPQEWLWCETWCDDKSKAGAKVIDLCNNPQTKEPKLNAGLRIIEEWKDYDLEVRDMVNNYAKGIPASQNAQPKRKHQHNDDEL